MSASIDIDEIFAQDWENRPTERTLPWEENCDGITVVVEPKPIGPKTCACSTSMPVNIAATPNGRPMAAVRVSMVISTHRAMI
ncbi:hypothetical protein AGR1B_Lc50017 [Agrobacterium fabacearum S56]|nr:hypothetical protein AGR1B_Lc50017 [Agrobacterium fabacearum S56]SDB69765.1 hypothetical protein SAMN03159422_03585 [Agrobacterium fabrum]SER67138.1 hypothetical protein SAMN03159504_03387 [Agrobacterium fabrum]